MPGPNRNTFISEDWVLRKVEDSDAAICNSFDCGDADLNEYFHEDAVLHRAELLTQTYCLQLSKYSHVVLALLDFCNDAVHFGSAVKNAVSLDPRKQYRYLPAVKLTRFGVLRDLQRLNVGTHALNMTKQFFTTDNRTGCRFLTVDAYNNPNVLHFYEQNGFMPFGDKDKNKATRALFFDLKRFPLTN